MRARGAREQSTARPHTRAADDVRKVSPDLCDASTWGLRVVFDLVAVASWVGFAVLLSPHDGCRPRALLVLGPATVFCSGGDDVFQGRRRQVASCQIDDTGVSRVPDLKFGIR
jgi:hypothetical protein